MIRLDVSRLLPPAATERAESRIATASARIAAWALVLVNAALTAQGVWLLLAPILRAPSQQTADLPWRRQILMETLLDLRETTLTVVAQWGGAQLLLALVIWVVLVRYRALVPLMLAVVAVAQGLQFLIGQEQPLLARLLPFDGVASWVLLAITLVALGISIVRGDSAADSSPVLDSGHG